MKKSLWKTVLVATLVFAPAMNYAQDRAPESDKKEKPANVRPFRIGVKIGAPNLIGGNIEYVLPLLGRRFALNADYSNLKSEWLISEEDTEGSANEKMNFTYLDLGLNYYFFRPGKGLYAGASYGTIQLDAESPFEGGTEYIDEKHSSISLRLGARLGGLFYFRPEVGYSFDPIPDTYEIVTRYNDGTQETSTGELGAEGTPAEILAKGLILNIGFGFAF